MDETFRNGGEHDDRSPSHSLPAGAADDRAPGGRAREDGGAVHAGGAGEAGLSAANRAGDASHAGAPRAVTINHALALAAFIGLNIPFERRGEATSAINMFLNIVARYLEADRAGNLAERDRYEKLALEFCVAARAKVEEITGKAVTVTASGSLTESSPDPLHEVPAVTITGVSPPSPPPEALASVPPGASSTEQEQIVRSETADGGQADEPLEHAGTGKDVELPATSHAANAMSPISDTAARSPRYRASKI